MTLSPRLPYPLVAIGDLHGQRAELERLIERVDARPVWCDAALVFLGDLVDRGPDVCGALDLVLALLARSPGGAAVCGNHDLALVRAARLDEGPASPYWPERYHDLYDCAATFRSYLGRVPDARRVWQDELVLLREAMPDTHRRFLADLPWLVEAEGHLFLHCGLSPELEVSAEAQVEALRERRWERALLRPKAGTVTDEDWTPEYPVWLGADRALCDRPLAHPSKVQVNGHDQVRTADANAVRIRIDTSGGHDALTACLLRSATAPPEFLSSR